MGSSVLDLFGSELMPHSREGRDRQVPSRRRYPQRRTSATLVAPFTLIHLDHWARDDWEPNRSPFHVPVIDGRDGLVANWIEPGRHVGHGYE